MSKLLSIDPAVIKRLKALPAGERASTLLALCDLLEAFGRPHTHSGLGIRKLGDKLFECRFGLALRFLFLDRGSDLFVSFLGNHDEIQALLRRGYYK
ncbi:MAG: hypothetical protein ACOZIN_08235 [Myxococcota bacterium]